MPRVGKGAGFAAIVACALLAVGAGNAMAATSPVAFTPCASAAGFACAHLTVPLDPSGVVPGTVTLSIERKVAVTGTATQAVIALAGGPGQAAIPFAADFEEEMAPALGTRDLIVFDQRGTGTSGALSCPAFADAAVNITPTLTGLCATQLGVARGFYETDDSVADIEAIRVALGYSQVVIFGTSYGTKVALRYAEQYPSDVAGLVLDSTVPPNGPDVYSATSFAAVPGMLEHLCAHQACDGITESPVADLTTVLGRVNASPIRVPVIRGNGSIGHIKISGDNIFNALVAGDLDPPLRADLPAALHDAVHGDYALLAQIEFAANAPEGGIDDALYFATSCEENYYPWDRGATPSERATEALAAFEALPASTFAPFTAKTAYDSSDAPYCADWPFETTAPESTTGTLPNVPTLILSGSEDLRTPTANADEVAAEIPDATVVVVPNTGHSVLGSDPTACSQDAVKAFFDGAPIEPCSSTAIPNFLQPVPLPPESIGALRPAADTAGLPGRTVTAVVDTLAQAINEALETLLSGDSDSDTVRFGGLRSGWAEFSERGLTLHGYSYVRGVTLSGTFGAEDSARHVLRIAGRAAAAGDLTYDAKTHALAGTLGGISVESVSKALALATSETYGRLSRSARRG